MMESNVAADLAIVTESGIKAPIPGMPGLASPQWTFETRLDDDQPWQRSRKSWDHIHEASSAATQYMVVSAQNDWFVQVRLVPLVDEVTSN